MARRSRSPGHVRTATALAGVLAAGSMAFLWLACLSPAGRLGLNAAAGLFPMAAVMAAGRTAGYLCWAASGLLALIFLPDKGAALLYLSFFGLYPVLKSRFEGFRGQALCWLCKLAYFNLVLAVFWFFLKALLLPGLPAWMERPWAVWLAGNSVFLIYDIGLSRLIFGLSGRFSKGSGGRRGQ